MSNDYFDFADELRLVDYSRAKASAINALFAAVAAGFDRLPDAADLFGMAGFIADVGAVNALAGTHPYDDFAYEPGRELTVLVAHTSTGAATINVTPAGGVALGARAIVQPDGNPLIAGQLREGAVVKLVYDGTRFIAVAGLWADPVTMGALAALAAAMQGINILPPQSGESGVLRTTGSGTFWDEDTRPVADPAGNAGKLLRSVAGAWAASDQYPARVANRFLRTDGTAESWSRVFDQQDFAASGTWTKPAGASLVLVEMWGAGGGGGSGSNLNTPDNQMAPGAGGGGGSYQRRLFLASELDASVAVTVGAGGSGGAARTNQGDGNAGTAGGFSNFGTLVRAFGGKGGAGGTASGTALVKGGDGGDELGFDYSARSGSGGTRGDTFTGGVSSTGVATEALGRGQGGGAGGGFQAGAIYAPGYAPRGGSGGGTGSNGGLAATAGGAPPPATGGAGGVIGNRNGGAGGALQGGGGGFGAQSGVQAGAGGTGGAGGIASGGGGGGVGAGTAGGTPSGAGGAGGNGFVRVITL